MIVIPTCLAVLTALDVTLSLQGLVRQELNDDGAPRVYWLGSAGSRKVSAKFHIEQFELTSVARMPGDCVAVDGTLAHYYVATVTESDSR